MATFRITKLDKSMRSSAFRVAASVFVLLFVSATAMFAHGARQEQVVPVPAFRVITNEPYSALRVTETVQTLADGSRVTTPGESQKIYRDSQGRMRIESYPPTNVFNENPSIPHSIIIRDPVAGVTYTLDVKSHLVEVRRENFNFGSQDGSTPRPRPTPQPPVRVNPSAPPPIMMTTERLGTQVIEGVLAVGVRNSETIPIGARGNDEPLQITMERWFSTELDDNVLTKNSDPRTGDRTNRLTNIDRSEPDPVLFEVPGDYTLQQPLQ